MANTPGKSSLFIGDLAIFCSERDIEETFAPYGEIQEIKIMRSEETSRNLSYGFIKFSTPQSAKVAMAELNGVILCGRPLRIRWATYKSKLGGKEPKQDVLETSPVHVSFISYQIDKLVTEESLRQLFSQYGNVVDASIKKSMIDQDVRRQSGYGFVHYAITGEGIQSAIRAAQSLDDITVESVNYKCCLSHNLNKYLTGELTIPDDTVAINGGMGAQSMGGMMGGFDEFDSDQYFRPPSQNYHAGAPQMPPSNGLYRQAPQVPGPNQNNGYGAYGHQQPANQQYSAPSSQRYGQVYRPNGPPPPPQRARSFGPGGSYPPMHPDLQHPQQSNFDHQDLRYDNVDARYRPATAPAGPAYQQKYVVEEPSVDQYGQYRPQEMHSAPQLGQQHKLGWQQQNSGMPTGYQRQGQFSSGSATMAALGGMAAHQRAVGGGGYGAPGPAPRGPAAVGVTHSLPTGPTVDAASNRWSTGSYNIVPPGGELSNGAVRAPLSAPKPAVLAPGRPPQPTTAGIPRPPAMPEVHGAGHEARDPASLTGGFAGLSIHGHPPRPNNPYQKQAPMHVPLQSQPQSFSSLHQPQYAPGVNAQLPQQQPQSAPHYGLTYTVNPPVYSADGSMVQAPAVTVHVSPPISPLTPFRASPVIGQGQLTYNPFIAGGFSPLVSTIQGIQGALPSFLHAGMSPTMSPGHLMPRDVKFEESISNVHNLFTPAQYAQHSPLLSAHDVHLYSSPVMYHGTFSTAANVFDHGANGGFGGIYPAGVAQLNRKSAAPRAKKSPPGDAARNMSSTFATASAGAETGKTTTDPTSATTSNAAGPSAPDSTEVEEVSFPSGTTVATTSATDSFFGDALAAADGSPLGPLEAADDGELQNGTEIDGTEEAVPAAHSVGAAASYPDAPSATPPKSGSARRSMIMKHTKQLVA